MSRTWFRAASALLLTFLLAACGSGGGTRSSAADGVLLPPPDTTAASGAYEGATDYRIGALDLLQISVFGVEELSKEVRVNSNGQVSLPLIGSVMAGGHTHVQMLRRHRETLLLNPGSVGLPFEQVADGQVRNPPWAEYALVEWAGGEVSVALRRVPIDARAVVDAILRSGMPHAEWWAQDWAVA